MAKAPDRAVKVCCRYCRYFYGPRVSPVPNLVGFQCDHPKNCRPVLTWYDQNGRDHKHLPQEINKHNNCPWYERKEALLDVRPATPVEFIQRCLDSI